MISAKEARETVKLGKYEKASKQMKEIETKIEEAMSKGLYNACFDGCIELPNRNSLEELGYKVETGSQYNEQYFQILW